MLPMSKIPPVQHSSLLASTEKDVVDHSMKLKANAIDATLKEVRHDSNLLDLPSKEELLEASSINQLQFDGIDSLRKNPIQLEETF